MLGDYVAKLDRSCSRPDFKGFHYSARQVNLDFNIFIRLRGLGNLIEHRELFHKLGIDGIDDVYLIAILGVV